MFSIKSQKYNVVIVVFEIFSIVFGVLIALWVNNYRETAKEGRLVNTAMQNIEKEIIANKESVESVLDYHRKLKQDLDKITSDAEANSFTFTGYRPPLLFNSSFETAKATGVFGLMEYDLAAELNNVYASQKLVDDLFKLYLQGMIINPEFSMRRDLLVARTISFSFNDILPAEERLIQIYESVLAKFEDNR